MQNPIKFTADPMLWDFQLGCGLCVIAIAAAYIIFGG